MVKIKRVGYKKIKFNKSQNPETHIGEIFKGTDTYLQGREGWHKGSKSLKLLNLMT